MASEMTRAPRPLQPKSGPWPVGRTQMEYREIAFTPDIRDQLQNLFSGRAIVLLSGRAAPYALSQRAKR
jgi:hypothetical protein